ncbi:hypothetical protein STEG23_007700, partial [Scotinomys teguina]
SHLDRSSVQHPQPLNCLPADGNESLGLLPMSETAVSESPFQSSSMEKCLHVTLLV